MNYLTQNLKTRLADHKTIFQESDIDNISDTLSDFMEFIQSKPEISSILEELKRFKSYSDDYLVKIMGNNEELTSSSSKERAAFVYQFICFLKGKYSFPLAFTTPYFSTPSTLDKQNAKSVKQLVIPLIDYLKNNLNEANSVIYLLDRYKKRVEWFTKDELYQKYQKESIEKTLENDLRLFLFDQGIEYPISQATIGSNERVDIIANIETIDPLILEVKFLDKTKQYRKTKIKEGCEQAIRYATAYNKNVAYLAIFNVDDLDVIFDPLDFGNVFPPMIVQGNKTIYLVVIDIFPKASPSNRTNPEKLEIKKSDLV